MKLTQSVVLPALVAVAISLAGCSALKPKADLTQFYVLRVQPSGSAAAAPAQIHVGLGRIASYLENSQIAVQQGPNRVEYLDLYRWAEPLSRGVSRVLAGNLAGQFEGANLTVHPNPPQGESGYQVRYTVEQFEGTLTGPVTLEVSWQVVQRPSTTVIAAKRSAYTVPVRDKAHDVAAYVDRLSAAIAQWAEDVAAAIR